MRDRLAALLLLALLAALRAPEAAEVDRRAAIDFHQVARVEGDVEPGGAYAIALSDEVVSALARESELRLFDADGRELPSLIASGRPRDEVVERPGLVFNRGFTGDGRQSFSLELADRPPEPINELAIEISDRDYHARVRVEGSDDGQAWAIVADSQNLIRHTLAEEEIDYVHDVLRIPSSRFRYYRFTLEPRALVGEIPDPLDVVDVTVREVVRRDSSVAVPVSLAAFEDPDDGDSRHQYWRLDVGREGLGISGLKLAIPADEYERCASLWEWSAERGRRTRLLQKTVVFQYGEDVHTEFGDFSTDASALVVMLDQGDDEPVPVTGVRASRPLAQARFLAPETLRAPLAIYVDPDEPRDPRYDLPRRLREREVASFTEIRHAALEPNPVYQEPREPRSERLPYLLYVVVIPLVLGFGWYVARTIRRGLPDEKASGDS